MPRDAKRMEPMKMWNGPCYVIVSDSGDIWTDLTFNWAGACVDLRNCKDQWETRRFRIARVEIRELPPKRKRHAP